MSRRMLRQSLERTGMVPQSPLGREMTEQVRTIGQAETLKRLVTREEDEFTEELQKQVKQKQLRNQLRDLDHASAGLNDSDTELDRHLKRTLRLREIEALDRQGTQGGPAKDVMAFAEGAVNIQKAAADTAMNVADRERQLRLEAEQNAAGMADYARQEEQHKATQTIEIIKAMTTANMGMLEKFHATELQFKDFQLNTTVNSITKATEDAIARITSASETTLALKEQLHQRDLENLRLQHEKEKAEMKSALPPNADPQYLYHMSWVKAQDEDRQAARAQQQAEHESRLKMFEWVRDDVGPKAMDAITTTVRQLGGGLSVDNAAAASGVPPRPPSAPGIGGAE